MGKVRAIFIDVLGALRMEEIEEPKDDVQYYVFLVGREQRNFKLLSISFSETYALKYYIFEEVIE